jgi:hypothetical protein
MFWDFRALNKPTIILNQLGLMLMYGSMQNASAYMKKLCSRIQEYQPKKILSKVLMSQNLNQAECLIMTM